MNSFRKWLYRPKKTDTSLLASFFFADDDLTHVAAELDSFDGRKDPERCTILVNTLRVCQDKVLTIVQKIMNEAIPGERANRDFRVKFPDDVLQESLAGQLWFGAECLAAGSSILNREVESASMRPLARALTKNLDSLRSILREQCFRNCTEYSDRIKEALIIFDKLFAEFELSYVSAMVPVKTMKEYDMLQEVTVLFSETVHRALTLELLTQDMLDDCDPALMFTIPRLAIVCGLLVYPEGPLNPDMEPTNMTEMFRPFQTLLHKIRELLYTLSASELSMLEKSLCSSEEPEMPGTQSVGSQSDSLLQIDQGFHEEGEGIIGFESISDILPVDSNSPVTPVNLIPDGVEGIDFSQLSPSSTIVDDLQHDLAEGSLNKSESQDSGLQSENVSTSDTVTIDSPQLASRNHGATWCGTSDSGEDNKVSEGSDKSVDKLTDVKRDLPSCDDNIKPCDNKTDNASNLTVNSEVKEETEAVNICSDILAEIVFNAMVASQENQTSSNESNDSENTNSAVKEEIVNGEDSNNDTNVENPSEASTSQGVSRQFSWQYNVQFALPTISLTERETDRQSSSSFSSDSTLSDQGLQAESVSDFVIETLANMAATGDNNDRPTTNTLCPPHTGGRHRTRGAVKGKSPQKSQKHSKKNGCATSSVHSNTIDLTLPSRSQTTNQNQASKPKPRSAQDKRDSMENISCETGAQVDIPSNSKVPENVNNTGDNNENIKTEDKVETCGNTEVSTKDSNPEVCEDTSESSSCSSCPTSSVSFCDSEHCSCDGSETSSYNSETNDEEEIALAIQAAEKASRNEARARFRSSSDLIHRLFVCIAGVADQLQTNYASDLRHILKCVFEMNVSYSPEEETVPTVNSPTTTTPNNENGIPEVPSNQTESNQIPDNQGNRVQSPSNQNREQQLPNNQSVTVGNQSVRNNEQRSHSSQGNRPPHSPRRILDEPPEWVPDSEVERCTACKTPFTFVRRRHHCRNCGKIFCGKCSSTTVPLPQYGHQKPVRVCHRCFLYQVTHFTVSSEY